MDISRPDLARKKKLRQTLCVVIAAIVVVVITVGVSRLEPAAPLVDRDTVYLDTVQRGPMDLLNQRATLATTEAQWKTARLQADADGQRYAQGLVSSLQLQQSQSAEQELDMRYALEGLQPGDRVVLSDMSTWDQFDRVRIE